MRTLRHALVIGGVLLVSCTPPGGGGGPLGGGSGSTGGGNGVTGGSGGVDAGLDKEAALDAALNTGDVTGLDLETLKQRLARVSRETRVAQQERITSLFAGVDSAYDPTRWSNFVTPTVGDVAQPYIVGDDGNVLASLSIGGGGRSAGYGVQVLAQFKNNENSAHRPAFVRLVTWLVTGDANGTLPANFEVTFTGLDNANDTAAGLTAAGITFTRSTCTEFSCAASSQLVIVGSDLAPSDTLEATVAARLAAGLPVLYLHDSNSGWTDSASGRQILGAMSLELSNNGVGNYFAQDKVASGRTNEALLATAAGFDVLAQQVTSDSWRTDFNWSSCTSSVGTTNCDNVPGLEAWDSQVEALRSTIDGFSARGRDYFTTPGATLMRLWSLWADMIRSDIHYPMDKLTPAPFQAAYIADAVVPYVRAIAPAQADLGTYASTAQHALQPSNDEETLTIKLPAESGFTTIGRMAVPGHTLEVTVIDAAGATLALQINTQRGGSVRWWNQNGFNRPRFVTSPKIALGAAKLNLTSPYGGTLQLQYSGATAGQIVQLKLRGVAKHPFLDETAGGDVMAARTAFIAALAAGGSDWAEIKMNGVEIHTRVDKLTEVVSGDYANDTARYLQEIQELFFEDAYTFAGFAVPNKTLPVAVQTVCTSHHWDCTNTTWHRVPGVQHINVDNTAACGSGCSGNPYDQSWGLGPRGWGESHELGHNLQQFRVYDDRSGEVSNNMFPLHKDRRMFVDLADDREPDRVQYEDAFNLIVSGKSQTDPVQGVYDNIWSNSAYAAQNGVRMAFFVQWVHYWAAKQNDVARGWDLWTLAYLHHRIAENATWASAKDDLGYSTWATKPDLDPNDELLMTLSWLTEKDQRPTFALWGITTSAEAQAQVAAYGFAAEPAFFFANTSTNDYSTVQRVDMTVATPVWPF